MRIRNVATTILLVLAAGPHEGGCRTSEEPCAADLGSRPQVEGPRLECTDNGVVALGPVLLENNVWNRGDLSDYSQCVEAVAGDPLDLRWRWSWPAGDQMPRASPGVVFGWKPWQPRSTSSALPRRLDEIRRMVVDYEVDVRAKGRFNMAFDLWVTGSLPPTPESVTHEIMIWSMNAGMVPHGDRMDRVSIGGVRYEVYKGPMEKWMYIAFASTENRSAGRLPVHEFLRYLEREGHVPPGAYLASIDYGNEVVEGQGETTLRCFGIDAR